jgi:hypothetical protein
MLFFVTRGLLVSLNQIAYLIVYEVSPVSLHWYLFSLSMARWYFMLLFFRLAFLLLLPKLYVITMSMLICSVGKWHVADLSALSGHVNNYLARFHLTCATNYILLNT